MSKHTPGYEGPVPPRRCAICNRDGYHWEKDCPLAKAAPDLLEALEEIANAKARGWGELQGIARAAINKTKGETNDA